MDSRGCQLPRAKSANLVIWSLAEAAIGGCGEDGMGNPCRAFDSSGIGIRRARRQAHLLQAACPKAHVFSFYFSFSLRSTCEALLSISLTLRRKKRKKRKKIAVTPATHNSPNMDFEQTPRKLWEHPDPKSTAMWAFMQDANAKYGLNMQVSWGNFTSIRFLST